jgi:hypothetical protein
MDASNARVAIARLGAQNSLPLFRHCLSLSCVILRCFPLSLAAGRRAANLSEGFCTLTWRVAQRGRFALKNGRGGIGCHWHDIIRLPDLGVVHVEEAWNDSGCVGGRRVVICAVGSAEGGGCMLIVFVD